MHPIMHFLLQTVENKPLNIKTNLPKPLDYYFIVFFFITFFLFEELEGVMNSMLSLILVVTENRDDLIRKFCNKVVETNSEEDTSLSRLRM